MVEKLARDLGASLYYLLQKGEKVFVHDAVYKVLKRVAEDNVLVLIKGFLDAFLPKKDYLTLYNFYYIARNGDLLKADLSELHGLLIAYQVHFPFWEFYVNQNIKPNRGDVTFGLEIYCPQIMRDTTEKVKHLQVIVSHPDCDLRMKRSIAKKILAFKSVWRVDGKHANLFLDFGDTEFAHCLIYYALQKVRPRQNDPWQKVAFALAEKHGYDQNFNPSIHKQKKVIRNLTAIRKALPMEESSEESDDDFSFYSESTDSEEYLSHDWSEESSDPGEYDY